MVGGLNYFRTAEQTVDNTISNLASETRLMAASFQSSYDALQRDARILSEMPPVSGLMRSLASDDIDPIDGSTAAQWRERLSSIFASVLRGNPLYTQLRFIGLADGGRELVRVNRIKREIVTVPESELQRKAEESYVKEVQNGRKAFFFTRVTLNREHGEIEDEAAPTIRAIMPVSDDKSDAFGLIVVNVDYEALMRQMLESASPGKNAFLFNEAGDYAEYDPQSDLVHVKIHDRDAQKPPEFFARIEASASAGEALFEDSAVLSYAKLRTSGASETEFVAAVLRLPRDELLAHARSSGWEAIILTLALTIVSAVVATWLAGRVTASLVSMTQAIQETMGRSIPLGLPTEKNDEVGKLANAFVEIMSSLLERRSQIEAIYSNTSDGMFIIDEFGAIEECNQAFQTLFGYDLFEVVGKKFDSLMPGFFAGSFHQHIERRMTSNKEKFFGTIHEAEALRKNGSSFSVDFSISRIVSDGRRLFVGTVRDISARKSAEKDLRLLKAAVENSKDVVVIANADADSPEVVYINDASREVSGYEPAELIGQPLQVLHGENTDRAEVQALYEAVRLHEPFSIEMASCQKDGGEYWVDISMVPIMDTEGSVTHMAAIERDITQARLSRLELAKSKAIIDAISKLQTIFISGDENINVFDEAMRSLLDISSSAAGYIDELKKDENGELVFIRRAGHGFVRTDDDRDENALSEFSRDAIEAVKTKTLSGIVTSSEFSEIFSGAAGKGKADNASVHDAKAFRTFLGLPLMGNNGQAVGVIGLGNAPMGYGADVIAHLKLLASACASFITAEQDQERYGQSEREIVRYTKALERSNQELDAFAYSASHDLKAPLRVIDNASRWLEEDLEQFLDEDSKENMTLMRGRVHRMEKLLDDLLAYSRIGRQVETGASEIVSGEELSRDLLQLIPSSRDFTIHFAQEFTSLQLPRMPLQQVLLNLISNAIKHHDKESGTVEISISSCDDKYIVSVEDDGPGIAPQYQEQVFGMFQTLKPRDQVEGSGMGLAMVKKHVEHFGGEITLESDVGRGCIFRFTWPTGKSPLKMAA